MNNVSIKMDEWNESNLKEFFQILKNNTGLKLTLSYDNDSDKSKDNYVKITQLLAEIGIPSNLSGYSYLRKAIEICIHDRSEIDSVTKRLYPEIARHFATTPNKVEHAIRHAIESAWIKNDGKMQDIIFGKSVGKKSKPTNSAFIATITDYIQLRDVQELTY